MMGRSPYGRLLSHEELEMGLAVAPVFGSVPGTPGWVAKADRLRVTLPTYGFECPRRTQRDPGGWKLEHAL